MTSNNKYSKVLLELKEHYQKTLAELEAQTSQVKARLTSLDTLIEDPLLGSDILSVLQGEADSLDSAATAPKVAEVVAPKAEAKPKKATPRASSSTSKKKPSTAKKAVSQAKAKKKKQAKATKASSSSRPMQWPYTDMFKIDAIGRILKDNAGNLVHVDDLIVQLYGELSGDDLKVERDRMNKTMYTGVQKNRWRKDPKVPMSYIFEEKSEAKSKAAKA